MWKSITDAGVGSPSSAWGGTASTANVPSSSWALPSSSKTMGRFLKHMSYTGCRRPARLSPLSGDRAGRVRGDHPESPVRKVGPGASVASPAHKGATTEVVDPAPHRDATVSALVRLLPSLVEAPG